MSRKSRRNRYKQQPAQQKKQSMVQAMARDAYTNSLAYLGRASELEKANEYTRTSPASNIETLSVLYRENWIAKRIIDTPCEDMTRKWYDIETKVPQDKMDAFRKSEAHHNIKQEIANAIRWSRLYGGSAALMVVKGQEDMLDQPLDFDMMAPGCFKGLLVLDKTFTLEPSTELEDDMDDPDFGEPMWYEACIDYERSEIIKIHHSRLLIFKGRMLPTMEMIGERYWGAPELEHVYEELQRMDATSANIAQLVFQANLRTLKISDYGEALAMGTDQQISQLLAMIEYENRIMNSNGVQLLGAEDSMEQHPYTFSGIAEMYEKFCMNMAGAAEIPATKLFGRSPEGMNATGESDMKNYYEMISGLQERILKPALEKLLPVMAMSEWGVIPNDFEIVFNPIDSVTPADRANINAQNTGTIIQAFSAGLISQKTALLELQESGSEIGAWTKITDEDIEKASDEIDNGEEEQDPMAAMMGGGDPTAMDPASMAQMGAQSVPAGPEGQEPMQQEEEPQMPPESQQRQDENDGGPGSGPRPGYHKKNTIGGMIANAQNQAHKEAVTLPKKAPMMPERTKEYVQKQNKERKEFYNKSMGQKLHEFNEGTAKPRGEVMKNAAKKLFSGHPKQAAEEFHKHKDLWIEGTNDRINALDWEESDHPRGKGGKFVSKGSGSSSSEVAESASKVEKASTSSYNGGGKSRTGWSRLTAKIEVPGVKGAKKYIKSYTEKHPEIKKEARKYRDVLSRVKNFTKWNPNAEDYNTYNAITGEKMNVESGFCVTFHQNTPGSDVYAGWSDDDYASMIAISMKELGAKSVNIGYFGNPEVSFVCNDENAAKSFAIKHNQHSVYNANTGRTLKNKRYNEELNPIRFD